MNIIQTIEEILEAKSWKQEHLAEELGVTQPTVSRWMTGADPRGSTRDALLELLTKVRNGGREPDMSSVASRLVAAPLVSWVSASSLVTPEIPVGEDDDHPLVYAHGLDPRGLWVALRVVGTSMDRISPPDSIIFVNRRNKKLVANACYVIASEDSGEATYKRFRPNPDRWEAVSTFEHDTIYAARGMEPVIVGRVELTTLAM